MEITHPRRILAVSRPDAGLSTIAGSSHTLPLKTRYYTASIPIWLDEIALPSTPTLWAADFLAPEAEEVLSVLGAFIVAFRKPVNKNELEEVKDLLGKSRTPYLEIKTEEWEDICQESGFEYVDFERKGKNEYSGKWNRNSRRESIGMERVKEALEANDWDGGDDLGDDLTPADLEDNLSDEGEGSLDFGIDAAELKEDMLGMKQAIYGGGSNVDDGPNDGDGEKEVEQLQVMMLKLQAVKDKGAEMPEAERKKFAAKAVTDIMKTL
ncbi:alpha and gamma adaptin binding protein p34-domain-containing protein [Bisporella sp. PMI_857]|nr:alpha and gamma adaptin binding protein p34-domain-containing protein [Bisporella sp. PMI_857]KAH8600468.1 alpha and gamma adaptin binding protein p34-domain-containing protein [Bisporella sp. PMI_857]